jgi:hypothetical protein
MARSRHPDAAKRHHSRGKHSQDRGNQRRASCSAQFLLIVTLLAVIATPFVTGSSVQEPIISRPEQAPQGSHVAGSQLLSWWGQRGDVGRAITRLGGVQQCSEGINARVDSELLEHSTLGSCIQEAAGYDVTELLRVSKELVAPSREQTRRLCSSEACAAWLIQAAEAEWLPECRYRQSQTSVRSLVETLLRVREDLVTLGNEATVAPNASLFQELYELNQLSNLLSDKEDVLNQADTPVMRISRHLNAQDDFSIVESGDAPQLSAAVEEPDSNTGSANSASDSASFSGSTSASNSNSVGDFTSGSDLNSSDTAGFTSSGVGPHASSTATTTELTPSYAYVVGAWVLFNGSYFFLMRKK